MPLHTDLRPTTFDKIIGNKAVVSALKIELAKPKKAHCYMFSGASGCGKSTLVGICASLLGATTLDIHEYNIGDARGIDSAREIIQTMDSYPYGEATIIILEETHNSTKAFQEALLRPFENIPEHVYVFMATTNPTKIIPTLRRRFMEFKLEHISFEDMLLYLLTVNKQQGGKVTKAVISAIITQSDGSIGKALILLDKVMFLEEKDQLSIVQAIDKQDQTIINLCQALLYGKRWVQIVPIMKDLDGNVESYRQIILNYMMKVLLNPKSSKFHLTSANIINIFEEYTDNKAVFIKKCYQCTLE